MESHVLPPASKRYDIPDTSPQHDHAMAYAALASMADAVYCVDTAGCITFANTAFETMTGYALADLRGTASTRLFVPEAEALFTERRRQAYNGATVSPYLETVLLLKNGRRLAVALSVSSLVIEGQITGRVTVLHDLTARRQTEAARHEREERLRLASPSTDAPESLEVLWAEIRQRMGVCPSFFRLATPAPSVARTLFDLAKVAYLDSPLPAVFKEKLFTYLSRFCPVRYCVARHVAFLLGRGYIAGDPDAPALPAEEVAALLDEPFPDMEALARLLDELEVQPGPLADWPSFTSRLGRLVRVACAGVFLEPERAAKWCKALRQLLGPQRYEQLMLFLTFVRAAHFWTEVHPELALEGDVTTLLEEHEALANAILNSADTMLRFQIGERLAAELQELRHTAALTAPLRESEARFRSTFENAAVGIAHVGLDGHWLRVNGRLCEITGYCHEELLTRTFQDITHPNDLEADLTYVRQMLAGEIATYSMEKRYIRKDGGIAWINLTVSLVRKPSGEPDYFISVVEDIMLRKQAEEALRDLTATLEQRVAERTAALEQAHEALRREMAERQRVQEALFQQEKLAALGTLLANVAHELNNPLAVAVLQLDNLQGAWGSGAWSEDLEMLRQAVERCQGVVQSFLALARQQAPTRRAVALHAVIDDVLVLLGHTLEVDGITMQSHLPEDLPLLWGDPNQLHHVVANLITNAHHALRQTNSPRHLRLTAAATADRSQVRLEVTDSGPGIPEALQRRVFEPFFTTKPQGVGSGLGLPLCRSIVEGHGGTLHLASQPGNGTTVSVTLPVAVSEVRTLEAAPEPVGPVQRQGGTILLIDDEPGVQRALRRLLQRSGHDITTAANGMEGLAALEARSYEAILCDMRMPDLDGAGFYRELERRHPHLLSRIIFLTGDALSPEAQSFFAQVDRPRLLKPFRAQEVRRVIQQVLEAR